MAYVLIVDDDRDFSVAAETVLKGIGLDVDVEPSPESALASMKHRRPDLVVLDVMFPEDSEAGFRLARTMRHYEEDLKDVPILMLTAINASFPLGFTARDIDEVWMPASDVLHKPVNFSVLRERVMALLAGGPVGQDTDL